MDQNLDRDPRIMWTFSLAAGLAIIGAVAPIALTAGATSRVSNVWIPFLVATIAFGVNAFMYQQGRPIAVALYFLAGLAIVWGILSMLSVPLRIAVVGTCPVAQAHCPLGYEHPLSSGENSGLGTATFCGILAIFIGFYGLLLLYRSRNLAARSRASAWPATPPAPAPAPAPTLVVTVPPEPVAVAEPVPAAVPEPAPEPAPAPKPVRRAPRKKAAAPPELAAEEELKELPAPEEPKELPPPA